MHRIGLESLEKRRRNTTFSIMIKVLGNRTLHPILVKYFDGLRTECTSATITKKVTNELPKALRTNKDGFSKTDREYFRGIIFGNIVYDVTSSQSDRNCVVLNDIHIDIMDYIVSNICTDNEFRQMWIEFEWENKIVVNTTIRDLHLYLSVE